MLAGSVRYSPGGGTGQLVGRAYHKGFKGEFPAVHDGSGFVFLRLLPEAEAIVIQKTDGHVGGKDILQPCLNVWQKPVLNIGPFEGVGTVENQLVPLQCDDGGFIKPGFDRRL